MPLIEVAAAIICQNDQFLIAKRPEGIHKAGYWEFPGGKIEAGETASDAVIREIREELNIEIANPIAFTEIEFEYPEKSVLLKFFMVTEFSGEAIGLEGQQIKWVSKEQLSGYRFPEANLAVVNKLLELNVSR